MEEKWVEIDGYETLYQISNYGRVKSQPRYKLNNGGLMILNPRIIKQHPNSRGYYRVQLTDATGGRKRFFIHRLVALHFVNNPNAEINDVVNHLDSDHTNNRADNLEWTTAQGNVEHAVRNGRMKLSSERKKRIQDALWKYRKSVVGINIETGKTLHFSYLNECRNNGFEPSCVCDCCKGKRKTHKGYRWMYG